jgi:hypothetical protein
MWPTAALCAAAAIAFLILPEEMLKRFDAAWLRAALFMATAAALSLIAIQLYHLWHDPPPLRMTRHVMYYVEGLGFTATFSPLGIFGLQKFEGLGIAVTLQEAGSTSAIMLIATIAGLVMLNQHYTRVAAEQTVQK